MSTETIIILVIAILLIGALPRWSYSRQWGYGPSGLLTVVGIVILAWVFFGNGSRTGSGIDSRPMAREGSLRDAAQDVSAGVREAGQDIKRTAQDIVD